MEVIKKFEENVKKLVEDLRISLGASSVEVTAVADKFELGAKTFVRFENHDGRNTTANRPANSGPVC